MILDYPLAIISIYARRLNKSYSSKFPGDYDDEYLKYAEWYNSAETLW